MNTLLLSSHSNLIPLVMASVNRPTNVKQKEADVNQKLQFYGIYSGKYYNLSLTSTSLLPVNFLRPSAPKSLVT